MSNKFAACLIAAAHVAGGLPRLEQRPTLCAKKPPRGAAFSLNDAAAQAHVVAVEND